MNLSKEYLSIGIALIIAVIGAFAGIFWLLTQPPAIPTALRMPGADGTPKEARDGGKPADLKGMLRTFDGVPADLPGAWPAFRGPNRDNIVQNGAALSTEWGPDGPPVLWRTALGEGYAGPVVQAGRVYLIDYDEKAKSDAVRCFSLADGREIWRHSYRVVVKRNHGMSRTVPAVTADYLVTMGPRCHVVCLNPSSGEFRWGIDLQQEYAVKEPLWYTGQCPLIDGDQVVLAPCGSEVLMMAVDAATGVPRWKTPNPDGWKMSHASIMPALIAGKKMYVYAAVGGIAGVSADPADAGKLLWKIAWNPKVVAPSPLILDNGRILVTAGYGEGSMMFEVRAAAGEFTTEMIYRRTPKEGLASEQQTPIYADGLLYGIMPKDAGALRAQLVCYDPEGKLIWSSGQEHRFGLGPYLLADNKLFILGDEGELIVTKFSKTGYEPLARAQVLHGHEAWAPIALAGDRMLLRDSLEMVCISLAAKS